MLSKPVKIALVIFCFCVAIIGFMVRLPSAFHNVDKQMHAAFYFGAAAFLNILFAVKSPLKHALIFLLLFAFGAGIEKGQELYNRVFHVHFHGRFDPEDLAANVKGLVLFSVLWVLYQGIRFLIKPAVKKEKIVTITEEAKPVVAVTSSLYNVLRLSPMIPSYNIPETVAFFTDLLGFAIARNDGNYVILYKQQTTVHILRAGNDIGEMEFYLEVDKVDAVWNNMKDAVQHLRVKAPFDQPYGMRELHIVVPHTKTLMFIGQSIK